MSPEPAEGRGADATREMTFLLADPEKRLLRAMAERIPPAIHSDHLTIIGVLGSLGIAVGYALSSRDPAWLWLASVMLVVNWFGDSLDGTLARVRKAERPKYGYYLDHGVDAFTTVAIGVGIGLSPWVGMPPAMALVVVYLLLSINVYLEGAVYGVFRMAYGRIGPTEVRIVLILLNTFVILSPRLGVDPAGLRRYADWAIWGVAAVMAVLLLHRFGVNLRRLARLEPRKPG